jgi:hypothetical protein
VVPGIDARLVGGFVGHPSQRPFLIRDNEAV